jgi:hypothetical protein
MIPRRPPRFLYPKQLIQKTQSEAESGKIPPEKAEKTINFLKSRYQNQNKIKEGQSDPKLAAAIIELAEGPFATTYILQC